MRMMSHPIKSMNNKIEIIFEKKQIEILELKSTVTEIINSLEDLPGGPVAKTPRSQCRRPGFNPWSGN